MWRHSGAGGLRLICLRRPVSGPERRAYTFGSRECLPERLEASGSAREPRTVRRTIIGSFRFWRPTESEQKETRAPAARLGVARDEASLSQQQAEISPHPGGAEEGEGSPLIASANVDASFSFLAAQILISIQPLAAADKAAPSGSAPLALPALASFA